MHRSNRVTAALIAIAINAVSIQTVVTVPATASVPTHSVAPVTPEFA